MNTARLNNTHDNIAFLRLCVLLKIDVKRSNITVNAQGLMLSDIAAGIIIPKKARLEGSLLAHVSSQFSATQVDIVGDCFLFSSKCLMISPSPMIHDLPSPLSIRSMGIH